MEGYGVSQIESHSAISWNQSVSKQLVERKERSVLKEENLSVCQSYQSC